MGFGINFNNKPIIKEAQAMHDDGGAGNLGYFEQEEKKKKDSEKSIFNEAKEKEDTFEKDGVNENHSDDFSISRLIAQVILALRDWLKKVLKF